MSPRHVASATSARFCFEAHVCHQASYIQLPVTALHLHAFSVLYLGSRSHQQRSARWQASMYVSASGHHCGCCRCASAVALFSRANLTRPLALLPTMTSASTCVRFCPVFFASTRAHSPANSNQETCTQVAGKAPDKAAGGAEAAGTCSRAPFDLGYKLVYAVGTTDSLFLFDTGERGTALRACCPIPQMAPEPHAVPVAA